MSFVHRFFAFIAIAVLCVIRVDFADAHSGRRFAIEVVGGKLQAQGINTGPSDGAPAIRPYVNSLHDHWENVDVLEIAKATLPGFDVTPSASTALLGHALDLELLGVEKWVSPPAMPDASVTPSLEPLGSGQLIKIVGPESEIDSDVRGLLRIVGEVPFGGVADIDLFYEINEIPADEIHVLRFQLTAERLAGSQPAVEASDSIYVLLSPDGVTPFERLHHASLYLEEYVVTIPEPSTAVISLFVSLACLFTRRQRKMTR